MPANHIHAGIAAWNFKLLGKVNSYAEAETFMREHGDDGFAKLGPHMTLIHEGHDLDPDQGARTYAVELYSTKILRYYPDGTFSVSNGGHPTPTTTARLNAVLPEGFSAFHQERMLGLNYRRGLRTAQLKQLDHGIRIIAAGTVEDGTDVPRDVEYPYIDLSHSMTTADLEIA
jgi:hypothetical protein